MASCSTKIAIIQLFAIGACTMRSVLSFTRYRGRHRLAFTTTVSTVRSRSDLPKTPARASNPYFPSKKRNVDALFASFSEGDMVSVKGMDIRRHDGQESSSNASRPSCGTIIEERGGGWYTVRLRDSGRLIKQRASNLAILDDDTAAQQGVQGAASNNEAFGGEGASAISIKEEATSYTTSVDTSMISSTGQAADRGVTSNSGRIVDLDHAVETGLPPHGFEQGFLNQCRNHASYDKWIVFTDLHVAPSTLQTCLQVLENVYSLAKSRGTGIMFLGDFWHHRGTVRIDCLNAVLSKMSSWDVPMIMIPGNHDQVTLGGLDHGLTPLQYAYRVPAVKPSLGYESFPGPLIFSYPTKFMDGLFVPYIRNSAKFRKILKSSESMSAKGLFVHADVTGALMNDQITCQGGVGPDAFPPNKPIYSGHFHKPHNVTAPLSAPGVSIQYLGSPYETSLSEAGQTKALVVLNAKRDWACVETIPLNIGRKHFRFHSMNKFLNSPLLQASTDEIILNDIDNFFIPPTEGDRIVLSVSGQDLAVHRRSGEPNTGNLSKFDEQVNGLRKRGVKVEIRELKESVLVEHVTERMTDETARLAEDMSPKDTFTAFVKSEESRGNLKVELVPILMERGLETIEEILNPENATEEDPLIMPSYNRESSSATDLILEKVDVEGFGSFRQKVCYPLDGRGLVLLRGSNKDGGADSNGSGKSTLAMATLWALTGSTDTRPMQDARAVDIVNDSSKMASVSIHGTVNSINFVITRTKGGRKGGLEFILDGEDLTKQAIKDTQIAINESLGVGPQILARTIFNGQHAMNGLLETTDARLKEELSVIVPLELWQSAASIARSKGRSLLADASKYQAMHSLRSKDVDALSRKVDSSKDEVDTRLKNLKRQREKMHKTSFQSEESSTDTMSNEEILSLQEKMEKVEGELMELESHLRQETERKALELRSLQIEADVAHNSTKKSRDALMKGERAFDRAENVFLNANNNLQQVELKWERFSGNKPSVLAQQTCPTCKQPIGRNDGDHSHAELILTMKKEVDVAILKVSDAEGEYKRTLSGKEYFSNMLKERELESRKRHDSLVEAKARWKVHMEQLNDNVITSRRRQLETTKALSQAATKKREAEAILSQKAVASVEMERFEESHATAQKVYEDLNGELNRNKSFLKELITEEEAAKNDSTMMSALSEIFGSKGVQTFVLTNAVYALQLSSQRYLDELSDGTQRLELSLEAGDRIIRQAAVQGQDGEWVQRPLSALSGGQWRRCSLALTLGFAELVARRGRLRPSLLVLDEPLTHLDATGRSYVGSLLRKMLRRRSSNHDDVLEMNLNDGLDSSELNLSTILVILQDLAAEELEEAFDHIDEVRKENGESSVRIDADCGEVRSY